MWMIILCGLAAYADDFTPLYSSQAESTSFLKSSWNKYNENYHPNYVLDDNPKTAWVEGVEGNGEKEKILIPFSNIDKVKQIRIKIRNGYQKSKNLLRANSAPKDVTIRLLSRNGTLVTQQKAVLKRTMGWQEIEIPISSPQKKLSILELAIDSTHSGSKYKDTCISDIEIWVNSDSEYKPNIEQYKKNELRKWVSERVADAEYFAKKPTEYPFVDTQFSEKKTIFSKGDFEQVYAPLQKVFESKNISKTYYTRENKNKVRTMPDGLTALPNDIWRLSDLAMFETQKKNAYFREIAEGYNDEKWTPESKSLLGNLRQIKDPDGRISHLLYEKGDWICERGCYGSTHNILGHYEEDRLIQLLIKTETYGGEPGTDENKNRVYTFQYKNEKVVHVQMRLKHEFETWNEEYKEKGDEEIIMKTEYTQIEYTPSAH